MSSVSGNTTPTTLAQIMAVMQEVEGKIVQTGAIESQVSGSIAQTQTDVAQQQLTATEEYNAESPSASVAGLVSVIASGIASGAGLIGVGVGAGMSAAADTCASLISNGATVLQIGGQLTDAGANIDLATLDIKQGKAQAQQDYYTSSGSVLGEVSKADQSEISTVFSAVQTLSSDVNSIIAQENAASKYQR